MSERMTPGQAFRIGEIAAEAAFKAELPKDFVQVVVGSRSNEFGEAVVALIKQLGCVNPYADKIVEPQCDYPPSWQMKGWEEQTKLLSGFYPDLNSDGLAEQAKRYLDQPELWAATFEFRGRKVRLFDGLFVFPLPGKVAAKRVIGDLWADVALGIKGDGLWGKLCEEILFTPLAKQFPGFFNLHRSEMGSDRFLPLDEVFQWLQQLEAQIPGDFACRPCNFGRRLAGHAVVASRWAAEHLLSAIVTPSWVNGNGLLTHPDRLTDYDYLWIDNAGDQYRFEDARAFGGAPCFHRDDADLGFGTNDVGDACGYCGAVFVLR